jgi:hypothetical protein
VSKRKTDRELLRAARREITELRRGLRVAIDDLNLEFRTRRLAESNALALIARLERLAPRLVHES